MQTSSGDEASYRLGIRARHLAGSLLGVYVGEAFPGVDPGQVSAAK